MTGNDRGAAESFRLLTSGYLYSAPRWQGDHLCYTHCDSRLYELLRDPLARFDPPLGEAIAISTPCFKISAMKIAKIMKFLRKLLEQHNVRDVTERKYLIHGKGGKGLQLGFKFRFDVRYRYSNPIRCLGCCWKMGQTWLHVTSCDCGRKLLHVAKSCEKCTSKCRSPLTPRRIWFKAMPMRSTACGGTNNGLCETDLNV